MLGAMGAMGPADVEQGAEEMQRALRPHVGEDWSGPAGPLEWSCRETAVHVAHDLLAYAAQVAARAPAAYLPLDLIVDRDAGPEEVLDVVSACAGLLCSVLATAGPDARAWHWGSTDPAGFAALGVNEILVHTWHITAGLGVAWSPPAPLAAAVVRRLFPDAPSGDPASVLLWCTGRGELVGRPRRTAWSLRAALE